MHQLRFLLNQGPKPSPIYFPIRRALSSLRKPPCSRSRNTQRPTARWIHSSATRSTIFEPNTKANPTQHTLPSHDIRPVVSESVHGRTRAYFPDRGTLGWRWDDEHRDEFGKSRNRFGTSTYRAVNAWVRAMFLPVGYPGSVHPCYAKFHWWQGLETLVWSSASVLCNQAMLASLGLNAAQATGGAVAIQWVLKDGFGEIGKMLFIRRFSNSLDSHPKTWKLAGEAFSLLGSTMQLLTVVSPPSFFLPLASVGNAFRSIHFSIFGAAHMTFTRSFALQGNVGDVVAKDDAQMSLAHLLGMLGGVTLLSVSHTPMFLFGLFGAFAPLHFAITVAMIKAANFEILNQAKLTLLARAYVFDGAKVPNPEGLRQKERGFGEWINYQVQKVPRISMGSTVRDAFGTKENGLAALQRTVGVMKSEEYLLTYRDGRIHVLYNRKAETHHVIISVLHAVKYHQTLVALGRTLLESGKSLVDETRDYDSLPSSTIESCATLAASDSEVSVRALENSLQWTQQTYPKFMAELDEKDWESQSIFWGDTGSRLEWERPDNSEAENEKTQIF